MLHHWRVSPAAGPGAPGARAASGAPLASAGRAHPRPPPSPATARIHAVHACRSLTALPAGGQGVVLAGVGARGRARMQRLDAEEAAVAGQPLSIDGGVPQAQLRDEEAAEREVAEQVRARRAPGVVRADARRGRVVTLHAAAQGLRRDRTTAQSVQRDISGLNKFISDLDARFMKYENGNPYWDKSVTFTLEDEDQGEDDDSEVRVACVPFAFATRTRAHVCETTGDVAGGGGRLQGQGAANCCRRKRRHRQPARVCRSTFRKRGQGTQARRCRHV